MTWQKFCHACRTGGVKLTLLQMSSKVAVLAFMLSVLASRSLALVSSLNKAAISRRLASNTKIAATIPSATVDIISPPSAESSEPSYQFSEADLGELLKSHKKAVLFAVPGAFTPTCSGKHLPGFIENFAALKAKGVDAIYCLSVNDKYVMRAWAEATPGCKDTGIKLVADGNGDFAKAFGLSKDATGSKMGIRCTRFAAIVEEGNVTSLQVDEKGLEKSSAENILSLL